MFTLSQLTDNGFFTLLILGVLLLFSLFTLAIVLERLFFFKKYSIKIAFYKKYLPDRLVELRRYFQNVEKKHPFDEVLNGVIRSPIINRNEIRERLDGQFTELYLFYHKRIHLLGIFAKLSTLLGLLGTVTGMIQSFNSIVAKGISTASIVAGGISQALITTAAGLIIAIPATFFYEYFNEKTNREVHKMEIITSDLLSTIIDRSRLQGER